MDINSIKFGKGIHSKKEEKAKKEEPVVVDKKTEQERTALEKIRSKAISSYAAAMLGLGTMGTASLTSCAEQDVTVTDDGTQAEMLKVLQQLLKVVQGQSTLIQQAIELLEQNGSDNKELIALNKQLLAQSQQIMAILQGIGSDVSNIESALYQIVSIIQDSNSHDDEFLNLINQILNGQGTTNEKLEQILEANREQNEMLVNLTTLIGSVGDELSETLKNFYNDYKEGQASHSEMLNNIYQELIHSNELSSENIAEIKKLYELVQNGQMSEAEMLGKITQLLESIDGKLDGLMDVINDMGTGNKELAEILTSFYNDYKSGTITTNGLLTKIMQAIENANQNDGAVLAELQKISQQIEDGSISLSQALGQITSLLESINTNTAGILEQVTNISGQIDRLSTQLQNNHDESMDILSSLNNHAGSIDSKLDQVISNQQQANKTLTDLSTKTDEVISKLAQISDKTITVDQMKEILGPMFDVIAGKLDNISGGQISIEEIENALAENKTDLTQTNALIETLTTVVQNLDLNSGMTAELQAITQAIKDFQSQNHEDSDAQLNGLREILAELAQIKTNQTSQTDVLNAILEAAGQIKDNQDQFMASATTFGTQLFEELNKISSNMIDKNAFATYADDYREQLAQAEQTRQEQLAVLQAILENQGQADGGMTIEELKQIIPDYSEILNEISDKIGDLVTKVDLIDYGNNHKVDLTQTNALIETLTTVVQNLPIGGGTSGGSLNSDALNQINQTVSQILSAINRQDTPSSDQIEKLIEAVNVIVANTGNSNPGTIADAGSRVKGTYVITPYDIQKAYEKNMMA